jgi:serine protease Do
MSISQTTLEMNLALLADRLRVSTVHIQAGRRGSGSGVIWRQDGLIVTNAHVAGNHSTRVQLHDGQEFDGRLLAIDGRRDLAAVQIDASDLPAATPADSDSLRVGHLVVAMGHPLGISGALTTGVVHAVARRAEGRGNWIQADIDLAPGNSGGPLSDASGRVLGINSMVAGGLGLAVPANEVKRFLAEHAKPRLGISVEPVRVPLGPSAKTNGIPGLLIVAVETASRADDAGLNLGDVVIGVNGNKFRDHRSLGIALAGPRSDETIELDILRGGVQQRVLLSPGGEQGASTMEAA